jgi:phosphatidylserine/phosphatidylglycerophosphate/cardiolipin synthase-like enzyme
VEIVLSNAGEDTKGTDDGDSTNMKARKLLHKDKIEVADRMMKKGHIGHNKFVVYVNRRGPQAVLSGSTNWTPSGLCAQSNNAIVIESPALAKEYLAYWEKLKQDTQAANKKKDRTLLQASPFRKSNMPARTVHNLQDVDGRASGDIHVWFSPNTKQKSVPKKKVTPPDLEEVFKLIHEARQGILFLAFIPGNPSVVTEMKRAYDEKRAKGQLFYLRGAATSPDPASAFHVDLYHRTSKADATVRGIPEPDRASAQVASVAGIFEGFAYWETELYKLGHAVIHDKILVIDPFTDDSIVVTGSHNLGFRASYCNDENMLILRGNRAVAEAYAAHVLDVYEHYRWRWRLQQPMRDAFEQAKKRYPKKDKAELWKDIVQKIGAKVRRQAWQGLCRDDRWQDYYQNNRALLAAEDNFWSPFSGVGLS